MRPVQKRIVAAAALVVVLSVPTQEAIVRTVTVTTAERLAGNLIQRLRPGHVRVGAVNTCDPPTDPESAATDPEWLSQSAASRTPRPVHQVYLPHSHFF